MSFTPSSPDNEAIRSINKQLILLNNSTTKANKRMFWLKYFINNFICCYGIFCCPISFKKIIPGFQLAGWNDTKKINYRYFITFNFITL
jgi:hypothetical protein